MYFDKLKISDRSFGAVYYMFLGCSIPLSRIVKLVHISSSLEWRQTSNIGKYRLYAGGKA